MFTYSTVMAICALNQIIPPKKANTNALSSGNTGHAFFFYSVTVNIPNEGYMNSNFSIYHIPNIFLISRN